MGFPSPAADYIDNGIYLVSLPIAHPSTTYVLEVASDSMRNIGILGGSLLVVDMSIEPCDALYALMKVNLCFVGLS